MRELRAPLHLQAALPLPPGINHTYQYRAAENVTHVTLGSRARQFREEAMLLLRAAGFRPLPEGRYWIRLELGVHTARQDVDASIKAVQDAVCAALGVDDRCVGDLHPVKVPASPAEQCVEVFCTIHPAPDRASFTVLSEAAVDRFTVNQEERHG